MSSEHLASAQNELKGNLGGAWNILDGAQGQYQDLGIARRFGGSAAAYSLRDIGAMNGRVVKVRRDGDDVEEDFSANQVQSSALENWVNGKLENALPADVATAAAAYSLRKVKASYASNAVRIRRSSDDAEVNVAFDSDDKVSTSSAISVVSGTVTDTTLGGFINGTDAFVHTWYDQAGSNNAVQATDANQPKIAESGALLADGLDFDGSNDFLESTTLSSIYTGTDTVSSAFIVVNSDAASTTQYIIGAGSTSAGNPMYNTLFHSSGNIGWQARDDAGTLKSNLSATPYVANQMYLVSNINSGTTTDFNSNAVIKDNGADSDVGAKTINTVKLGARGNGSSSPLNGSIKEAIFYATDQSNNRFKIESNINNYYSLYTTSGNGFVETLYDQSSNGNDVDQGTAGSQPAIVQNGGQVKVGNEASIKFDGTDDFLERATYTQGELTQINTIFSVAKLDTYADENRKVYDGHASTARNMLQLNPAGNGQFAHYAGTVAATGEDADANQHLFTSRLNGVSSSLYIDGVQKTTSNTGSFGMQGIIGANHDQTTNNCWKGDIQEIIVYNSDQNDDRANQQDDINNYYTIY